MKRIILLIVVAVGLALLGRLFFSTFPLSVIKNTVVPQPHSVIFGIIGDTEGHADVFERALSEARSRGATFMVHTGDLTENGDEADFSTLRDAADRVGIPVYAAVGNHDVRSDGSTKLFERFFNAPDFAVDADGFRLLVLNNEDRKVGFSQSTRDFVADDVAAHPDERYVVVFHRPFALPFTALFGDDETATSRPTNEAFLSLLGDTNVLAYFTGHLHTYLPYRLGNAKMFVTGGGGAEPQSGLSVLAPSSPHFLLARFDGSTLTTEYVTLD